MNFKITNTLGLARSVLALSSLLVLTFNDTGLLIPAHHFEYLQEAGKVSFVSKLNLFLYFDYSQLWIPKTICMAVLVLVISGYYPRYTCLFHSWIAYSIYNSLLIVEGGDQINSILLMLLLPVCLLDGRRNHWTGVTILRNEHLKYLSFLFLLTIKVQMAVIYLDAGVEKLKVEEWANGTAMYYWFNHNMFGLPASFQDSANVILSSKWVVAIFTWGVIMLEVLLFGGLFANYRIKSVLFMIAILFHFFIIVVHGLPSFFLAMASGLILYLWNFNQTISENYHRTKNNIKSMCHAAISF